MPSNDYESVVVGGGAAGVAAIRRLHDAGVNCLLVEARSRLGGRAFTAIHQGYPLDLGCGWLHSADSNPWADIAAAQGLTIDRTAPPWMKRAAPVVFPADDQNAFHDAMEAFDARIEAAACGTDCPASDCLEPGNRWNGLIGAVNSYISGASLDRISAHDLSNYADSGVNWRVAEGYGTAVANHAKHLPIALDCPVRVIDHSAKRIRLDTTRGTLTADAVIVTLPTSLIADETVVFKPALPDKHNAARGLPLGFNDKLFLLLDQADEFAPGSRLFGHTDREATGSYHLRPFGRPMIEVYFGGPNAEALEKGGAGAFADFAIAELTGLLGSAFAKRIKPLVIHLWGADPFARGAYSCALPGRAQDRSVLAAPVDGRLFFAGEACSTNDYSTAHGALRTGLAAAEAIIARCRRPEP